MAGLAYPVKWHGSWGELLETAATQLKIKVLSVSLLHQLSWKLYNMEDPAVCCWTLEIAANNERALTALWPPFFPPDHEAPEGAGILHHCLFSFCYQLWFQISTTAPKTLYLCHRITSSFFSCSHSECDYMSLAAIVCIWRHCHKLYFAGFLSVLEKTTYTICEPCWKHLILIAPAILYNSLIDIFTIRTTIIRASWFM